MERCTYRTVLACFSVLLSIHCSAGQTSGYNVNDSCPENVNLNNVTLVERVNITHPMYDDVMYYLYKINESALTWCESYKVCDQIGQRLAVLYTKDIQQTITILNMSDIGTIWIAGRRKDYGSDWTWINDTLTDLPDNFKVYDSNDTTKDCGRITLTRTGQLEITADICALLKQVICVVNGQVIKTSNTLSWYNAINLCINKGGRLATWQDVTNIARDGNSYWFGLHRRPWIWIDSDEEGHPVFYSSWLSTSGGDCIGMLSNGLWMATQCNKSLQYIICEEHTPPATEPSTLITTGMQDGGSSNNTYPSPSIWDTQGTLVIALSVTAGVMLLTVIIGIVIGVARTKRTKTLHSHDGVSNPAINEYCETQENGLAMNPPESTAYKPDATVSPYAEVKLPQTTLSSSSLEPRYVLAKDPEHMPNDGNVIYSEVHKPKEGGTTLFENTAYQPGDLHRAKKGPPKPKRLQQL